MQTSRLSHYIYIISHTFVTYDNFSELIRKISPTYNFSVDKTGRHKILMPKGPIAKEILDLRPLDLYLETTLVCQILKSRQQIIKKHSHLSHGHFLYTDVIMIDQVTPAILVICNIWTITSIVCYHHFLRIAKSKILLQTILVWV